MKLRSNLPTTINKMIILSSLSIFVIVSVNGFTRPLSILRFPCEFQQETQTNIVSMRNMAKQRRNNSHQNKKKKKLTPSPKQKNKNKSKNSNNANSKNTNVSMISSKQSTRSTPPWQVMSKKDQAKNAVALKAQREQLKKDPDIKIDTSIPTYSADMSNSNTLLSPTLRSLLSWKRFKPSSNTSTNTNNNNNDAKARELSYIGSYLSNNKPPSLGVPEIAFLGRSNVGKSSLLNKLTSSQIARVGKTPGATASVNLYCLSESTKNTPKPLLGLVDLPGFGYAKLSKERKEQVEVAAEQYLNSRKELSLGILLVDVRRDPSTEDKSILAALYDLNVPLCVIATKVDKLKPNEREKCIDNIHQGLGLPENQPLVMSSVTGEGVRDLWRIILDACNEKINDLKQSIEEGGEDEDEEDDWWASSEENDNVFQDGEDLVYDQGYDWVHGNNDDLFDNEEDESEMTSNSNTNFYDYDDSSDDDDYNPNINAKMLENQERQTQMNEAMKLKNLKKVARRMDRAGEV